MENFGAEDLSTIGGIATVSLLHSFIPTHWLPFSIVGRAQKWTLSRTLFVTAFGAVLHVISTSILGITAVTMANTIAGEETVHKLASLLLVFLGGGYILLFLSGKGGHSHSHNQPMEKMAVAGLVLVPALSPCATTLPVFLAVGNSSSMMLLAIIVLLFSTITVMTSLVALSFYGADKSKQWSDSVADYIVNKAWNREKLLTVLDTNTVDQICGIPIPMNSQQDSFVWGCSLDGEFTIKSATWIQNSEIWHKRNDSVFRNTIFSPCAFVACAATYHYATPNRINSSLSNTGSRLNIKWNPPPQGQVKINFDGLVIQQTSDVVAGFILRDDVGCPLIAFARKLKKTTIPIAEATALRDNLLRAQEMGIQDLLVEGDVNHQLC
ncbi:hypothetical protein ACLB2K_031660 [Fragaria x ananassa]